MIKEWMSSSGWGIGLYGYWGGWWDLRRSCSYLTIGFVTFFWPMQAGSDEGGSDARW